MGKYVLGQVFPSSLINSQFRPVTVVLLNAQALVNASLTRGGGGGGEGGSGGGRGGNW